MDAVKFLKAKKRMCEVELADCISCPLSSRNNGKNKPCCELVQENCEETVAIVEKWAKEHPQKTYRDDFREKFPKVVLSQHGYPITCRNLIYCGGGCTKPFVDCASCWNEPMEV